MTFSGFDSKDFDVFNVDGLDERMNALIEHIRPKLEALGEGIGPELSALVDEEMVAHVAKHARRTVNPPNDTWVAWANNKRGYKQHPHFQVGLWNTHLFVWFALIYESPLKVDFARHALPKVSTIKQTIPDHYVWSVDHMKPEAMAAKDVSEKNLTEMLERLVKVKKSEILCGINIDRNEAILQDGRALKERILETYRTLVPLYKLAQAK
jgi:uncharacterized protein YktB (UPF0637 family)